MASGTRSWMSSLVSLFVTAMAILVAMLPTLFATTH
jgi:hypothetical protein